MAPILSLDGAQLAVGKGVAGTPVPKRANRAFVGLCGSLGSLAGEPPAIVDDVFGAGGQVSRDAVFVVAAAGYVFAEEALGCLVVSLGFEDSGKV